MESNLIQTVSIVIPIFKAVDYIEEVLLRIDNTKRELEKADVHVIDVLLICDEPIDDSLRIIQELIKKKSLSYVKVCELAFNVGQHLATSAGILSAQGDWIISMDEDLQHPPEAIPNLLLTAQTQGLDLVYAKTNLAAIHATSIYRDFSSRTAKSLISHLTGLDIRTVSSYRCMRSQLARSCASSMDKFQYLDILLQFLTSKKRRGCCYLHMNDSRVENSGYTLPKLFSHFSKLVFSSLISGSRAFLVLLMPIIAVFLIGLFLFVNAVSSGSTTAYAPGWLSIFSMQLILSLIGITTLALLIKISSILMIRAISPPSFFVVDRSQDQYWAKKLAGLAKMH